MAAGVQAFVFTSTTSVFGDALIPPAGAPAAWITEDVTPVPEEHLRRHQGGGRGPLPARSTATRAARASCCAPRASSPRRTTTRQCARRYADANIKANEFLHRRVDIEDVVSAHLLAAEQRAGARLRQIHHQRHHAVLAARTSPSCARDAPARAAAARAGLSRPNMRGAAGACSRASTGSTSTSAPAPSSAGSRATTSPPSIARLRAGGDSRSPLAQAIGPKGYHARSLRGGPSRRTALRSAAEFQDRGPDQCRGDRREAREVQSLLEKHDADHDGENDAGLAQRRDERDRHHRHRPDDRPGRRIARQPRDDSGYARPARDRPGAVALLQPGDRRGDETSMRSARSRPCSHGPTRRRARPGRRAAYRRR